MFLKIFLLGAAKVGKSSLLGRFCRGVFDGTGYGETQAADFNGTRVRLSSGLEAVLAIWDLPGSPATQAKLERPPREYWAETHVCVLVCDMCSRESFIALERLRAEFLASYPEAMRASLSFVLLINKAEATHARKQAVFAGDVVSWCGLHNIRHFYETSALTDTNCRIALVNITQLAAEMDAVRRGIKVQLDAQEMARREAEEAAATAEANRIAAEAQAAEAAAIAAAEAEEAAKAQAILDAQLKREREFEQRWQQQKAEEEEARAAIAAERARVVAKRKEEADRRKKELAASAYGQYKQRPHRLSVALIQQHAQAAAPSPTNDEFSISPSLAALHAANGGSSISTPGSSPSPSPGEETTFHRPGALPASLHSGPRSQPHAKRPSILGLGAGAMLKLALQQGEGKGSGEHKNLAGISERPFTQEHRVQVTPTPPASGRARPPRAGHGRHASSGLTKSHHSISSSVTTTTSSSMTWSDPRPFSPQRVETDTPEIDSPQLSPTSRAQLATATASIEEPLDAASQELVDSVVDLVSFPRDEVVQLFAQFGGATAADKGLDFKAFKRVWSRVRTYGGGPGTVPSAQSALVGRVFAAFDELHSGRVSFSSFVRGLDTLAHGPTEVQAKLVFRMLDFEHSPFLEVPLVAKVDVPASEEGTDEKQCPSSPFPATAALLTKGSFIALNRSCLHGRERFAHDMYDVEPAADDETDPSSSSFITRSQLTKLSLLAAESLPAFQALRSRGESSEVLSACMSPLVEAMVSQWFEQIGCSKADTLTQEQWTQAAQARPHLLMPYLLAPAPATAAAAAAP